MKRHTLEVLIEHAVSWNKMYPFTRVVKLPNTAIGSMPTHRPTTVLLALKHLQAEIKWTPFQNSYIKLERLLLTSKCTSTNKEIPQ